MVLTLRVTRPLAVTPKVFELNTTPAAKSNADRERAYRQRIAAKAGQVPA